MDYGGVASRAVDGNLDPIWNHNACTHTSGEEEPYWCVACRPPARTQLARTLPA